MWRTLIDTFHSHNLLSSHWFYGFFFVIFWPNCPSPPLQNKIKNYTPYGFTIRMTRERWGLSTQETCWAFCLNQSITSIILWWSSHRTGSRFQFPNNLLIQHISAILKRDWNQQASVWPRIWWITHKSTSRICESSTAFTRHNMVSVSTF